MTTTLKYKTWIIEIPSDKEGYIIVKQGPCLSGSNIHMQASCKIGSQFNYANGTMVLDGVVVMKDYKIVVTQ